MYAILSCPTILRLADSVQVSIVRKITAFSLSTQEEGALPPRVVTILPDASPVLIPPHLISHLFTPLDLAYTFRPPRDHKRQLDARTGSYVHVERQRMAKEWSRHEIMLAIANGKTSEDNYPLNELCRQCLADDGNRLGPDWPPRSG